MAVLFLIWRLPLPCYSPIQLKRKSAKHGFSVFSCGNCIGCRLERSREQAMRCMHESFLHDDNCFVTLTYRELELPHGESGPILVPRDLELFWKRLRKEFGNGIRYYACGEYGERTHRPHYHACIFGLDFEDKTYEDTKGDFDYYHSDTLDRIWGYGRCIIGDVSFESAAYVARYITAKKTGPLKKFDDDMGITPEFVRMSRRPGLGAGWFEKFKSDIFPHGGILVRGKRSRPPRYYLDLLRRMDPFEAEIQSARRLHAQEVKYWHDYDVGAPKLSTRYRVLKKRINILTRGSI